MQSVFSNQTPMKKTDELIGQHGIKFDNMVGVNNFEIKV